MVSLALVVSIISTLTTGVFTALVFRRWLERRRPHHLAWAVGLLMYCLGTFSQVVLYFAWSPFFFGLWYWTGALMVAAWLGQGTVFLLWRRGNVAANLQMALILVGVMTLPWTLFLTPFNADAWRPGADMTEIYRPVLDSDGTILEPGIMPSESRGTVRFFSPIMNIWGTIALVGGAIYSAILFRRKEILRSRMMGNWLIAAGGLMPAIGGALLRLGDPSFKYFGEMLGAVLIFMGFLMATGPAEETPRRTRETAEAAGTGD